MATYKESGVDIDKANSALSKIKGHIRSTYNENTLSDVGSFGGCFKFPSSEYKNPIIVSSADGVGTKLKIAFLSQKHDTIGQCLVNHCVNDILAVGARPLFFLDYFAAGKLDPLTFEEVVKGIAIACKENSCVLIGGETAEMPGFYSDNDYDLSGTIVGVAEGDSILAKRQTKAGDLLVGLYSTGLHTNGYSLARKVLLEKFDINDDIPDTGLTVSNALLSVHRSYLPVIDGILEDSNLHAISHITGGGIIENTERVISHNQKLDIDWSSWEVPSIFSAIQNLGDVPTNDMRRTFNMGIGLVLVIDKNDLNKILNHLESLNEPFKIIGTVVE